MPNGYPTGPYIVFLMPPGVRFDGGLDRVLEAMQHPVRRQVLVTLLQDSSTSENASARIRLDIHNNERFGFDDETAHTTMRHIHLPKLDDYGFIAWDEQRGTVAPGPAWDAIEPILSVLDDHRDDLPDNWV